MRDSSTMQSTEVEPSLFAPVPGGLTAKSPVDAAPTISLGGKGQWFTGTGCSSWRVMFTQISVLGFRSIVLHSNSRSYLTRFTRFELLSTSKCPWCVLACQGVCLTQDAFRVLQPLNERYMVDRERRGGAT